MSKTVIVGSSFAGLTAALELRRRLPATETITVISKTESFFFYPSLIWVAQGERELEDISFPIRPILESAGIGFIQACLKKVNPREKKVVIQSPLELTTIYYDKLLLTTGGAWAWQTVPGLFPQPEGHTISILSPQEALTARTYWQTFLDNPGPMVIGAVSRTALFGAAYEFVLNIEIALRKAGIRDQVPMTFITPEPYLGHLGHDGLGNSRQLLENAFAKKGIGYLTGVQLERIEETAVIIKPNQRLESKFTMLIPPYQGIQPIRNVTKLTDKEGRIPVDDYYRSLAYSNIFAAGVAAQVKPFTQTTVPCGVLVTGTVSAEMGRIVAANIAADLGYGQRVLKPLKSLKGFYVLDSGSHGLFMSLGPQSWLNFQLNLPGPWSRWAKVITEKYQMWEIQSRTF